VITAKRAASRANTPFSVDVVAAIHTGHYLRIRAGTGDHRFTAIWAVVVDGRVFVRSWYMKPDGWHSTFLREPRGAILVGDREIPVRALRVRSERVKDAIDKAYAAKYKTAASIKYVKGFARGKRRETAMELLPS
jgi:hypothetical protein